MNRRVFALAGLLAFGLVCAATHSFAAATRCNPDYVYAWTTVKSAASSVPAAPVQPKAEAPAASSTATASGGGDDAGNLSEGGGSNLHKRGLHWQSFLPGVIK